MLKSEIIYKDIEYTLEELKRSDSKPVTVRREFGRFITLSQQMTEAMRKEYKSITGLKWVASEFDGWNMVTELFKELRKVDYHDSPIELHVSETQFHLVGERECDDNTLENLYLTPITTYSIGDPFSEEPVKLAKLLFYDENQVQLPYEEPEKYEYSYSINTDNKRIIKLLNDINEIDVIKLSTMCCEVLEKYINYYIKQVRVNR